MAMPPENVSTDEVSLTELIQHLTRTTARTARIRLLQEALPWVRFLPADAVEELVGELVDALRAAVQLNTVAPIAQVLAEWCHTAEVYADPELDEILSRPHDGDHGRAPIPGAAA